MCLYSGMGRGGYLKEKKHFFFGCESKNGSFLVAFFLGILLKWGSFFWGGFAPPPLGGSLLIQRKRGVGGRVCSMVEFIFGCYTNTQKKKLSIDPINPKRVLIRVIVDKK